MRFNQPNLLLCWYWSSDLSSEKLIFRLKSFNYSGSISLFKQSKRKKLKKFVV